MKRLAYLLLALTVLVLASCGGTSAEETTTSSAPDVTTTTEKVTTTVAETTTTTVSDAIVFGPEWFSVDLIVIESQCFNSAGANVTVIPELWTEVTANGYELGTFDFSQIPAMTIVYEINDGVGGATWTENVELDANGDYSYEDIFLSPDSCDYELTTEVVRVIER